MNQLLKRIRMKFTLVLSLIAFFTISACQEKKQTENEERQMAGTDSLRVYVTNMRYYISQSDSALIEISRLSTSDSVKDDLMSRDQDMVRIYNVEEPPVVDTLADNRDVLMREASRLLDKARALIASANQQIKRQQSLLDGDTVKSGAELIQLLNEHVKDVRDLIPKMEREAEKLEREIKKTGNM